MRRMRAWKLVAVWTVACAAVAGVDGGTVEESGDGGYVVRAGHYRLEIEKVGFRFRILRVDGEVIAPAHPVSGLQFGSVAEVDLGVSSSELQEMTRGRVHDVKATTLVSSDDQQAVFEVTSTAGEVARVGVAVLAHRVRMSVEPKGEELHAILFRTGRVGPAYGLSDHGSMGRESAEITGYASDYMGARTAEWETHREGRLISNFVIHPQQGLAAINVEPRKKIVRVTAGEEAHGSSASPELKAMYYFIGDPKRIYRELQEVRAVEGHPFHVPKPDLFGVGWEAFGALGWTTSAATVEENISTYLDLGYPLSWMVIGSGFWPSGSSELWGTTSFGMWDREKYPGPEAFLRKMEDRGLTTLIGLRIAFRKGNPFAKEAQGKGFLITDGKGEPKNFANKGGWPSYLLDFENPEAIDWYVAQCGKWLDAGVDGFKEDLMFFLDELERDDKVDEVNRRLSKAGVVLMLRNNYLGSPGDLHRYNDFNFYESQDRGPINGLCLAYSGFPYVYPDIVGGTKVWSEMEKGNASPEVVATYMMRYAEYAAVHPSMSFGYGPWSLGRKDVVEVTRNAAQLHHRLTPYIYSAALLTAESGFPYTMTPLPLAYPDDPEVYGLANATRRSYQWLLGESLMAVPLYGDDYATATSRDVYLPEGRWIDYDTGSTYEGPQTLDDFPLPIGKTPLFVGGKGIVIEQDFGRLLAKVYPVQNETAFLFRDREGKASRITVKVDSWETSPVQVRSGGEVLSTESQRGALVFPLEPGRDYEVASILMPDPVRLVKPAKRREKLPE